MLVSYLKLHSYVNSLLNFIFARTELIKNLNSYKVQKNFFKSAAPFKKQESQIHHYLFDAIFLFHFS